MQAQAGCMALCISAWAEDCNGCAEAMRFTAVPTAFASGHCER